MYKVVPGEKTLQLCAHCGADCGATPLLGNNQVFCCNGCKMAHTILQGGKINFAPQSTKEENELYQHLIQFKNETIAVAEFYIPEMVCASCIYTLEHAYQLEEGIKSVRVNFLQKRAKITFFHQRLGIADVISLLTEMGYKPEIKLEDENRAERNSLPGSFYIKLGLAGFGAGNIMLFSLPEYFGIQGDFSEQFRMVFAYLNVALSIPILLYSASDYFKAAWGALRVGKFNFEVPTCLGFTSVLGLSYYDIFWGSGQGYLDSFSSLIFFMLVARYFQNKTFETIHFDRNFASYLPVYALIWKGGQFIKQHIKKIEKKPHTTTEKLRYSTGRFYCSRSKYSGRLQLHHRRVFAGAGRDRQKDTGRSQVAGLSGQGGSRDPFRSKQAHHFVARQCICTKQSAKHSHAG